MVEKNTPPLVLSDDSLFHHEKTNHYLKQGGIFFILVIVFQKTLNFVQIHEVSSMQFLLKHRISSLTFDAREYHTTSPTQTRTKVMMSCAIFRQYPLSATRTAAERKATGFGQCFLFANLNFFDIYFRFFV